MKCRFLLGVVLVLVMTSRVHAEPDELTRLKNMSSVVLATDLKTQAERLRPEGIREAGMVVATQAAVRFRYGQIASELRDRSNDLDKVFNFAPLLMNQGKVVPPVIASAGKSVQIESPTEGSYTGATFRIISPARIVSVPPDWRSYLLYADLPDIQPVTPALLPQNKEEQAIWDAAVEDGWRLGLEHANRLFEVSLSRLVRDIRGILKFKTLVLQGMVTLPGYEEGRIGITVNGERLDVDQRTFRLVLPSRFLDPTHWKPILISSAGSAGGQDE